MYYGLSLSAFTETAPVLVFFKEKILEGDSRKIIKYSRK
jgi:hypothetical protein